MGARSREILARLGLCVAGIFVGLILLEVALQVAARFVRLGSTATGARGDAFRVVCLGDSNTYGLYVEPSEAWPEQLEETWNAAEGQVPIEVVNLGSPGNNSSRTRNQVAKVLETRKPGAILVMVGINDLWTEPEPVGGAPETWRMSLWRHSRVYRLFLMLFRSFQLADVRGTVGELQASEDGSGTEIRSAIVDGYETTVGFKAITKPHPEWRDRLVEDVEAMAEAGRAAGVDVVVLTYPTQGPYYAAVSDVVRNAARTAGAPLIDLYESFRGRCPTKKCPDLFFPDGHPNAKGHALVGDDVARALSSLHLTVQE